MNMLPKSVASVGLAGADFAFPQTEGFGMNENRVPLALDRQQIVG